MATFKSDDNKFEISIESEESATVDIAALVSEVSAASSEQFEPVRSANATIHERSSVPELHRRIADSYMIIKKVFGFPAVQCRITQAEIDFLDNNDFKLLQYTTAKQIKEEIGVLKNWHNSDNRSQREIAEVVINIRVRELKNLIATRCVSIQDETYDGYKELEKYFGNISKYYNYND